ncbi:MAG: cytochrome b [Magnetococcales bacterium]|nr:cytochrome b [Magnetococcales bacterium]
MRYDLTARLLHWLTALLLIALFGLGWYMTGLTYYDPDYRWTSELHKALGMTTAVVIVVRIVWRLGHQPPPPLASHAAWERALAKGVHLLLYLLMAALPITGYLMATAAGHAIDLFGLYEFPALLTAEKGREESMGMAHEWLAYGGGVLVLMHLGGVLKHQFIDGDATLARMLFGGPLEEK